MLQNVPKIHTILRLSKKEGQKFEPICTKCMILAITYSSHWDLWELVAINMHLFGSGITPWLLSLGEKQL